MLKHNLLNLAGILGCLLAWAAPGDRPVRAAGGQLQITVVDRDTRQPIACRMHLFNAAGRPQKAKRAPFWHDHFVFTDKITLRLPVGNYTFEMQRGPEYLTRGGHFRIENFADDVKQVDMKRFVDMSALGWWSGDLYVRRPVGDIELLMEADDLHVAQVVTWWNHTSDWDNRPLPENALVRFQGDRCYHLMAGGHDRAGTTLLYFNLPGPLKSGRNGGEYPPSMKYLLEARGDADLRVDLGMPFGWDLPMLVAHGQIDSVQLAHSHVCRETVIDHEAGGKARDKSRYPGSWGNAQWSQQIYFKLLECGLRIPPTAGSGSGVAPNPVGYNRVYVHLDGEFDYRQWWRNLRAGRVVVTNGPLLRPLVRGQLPGHVFRAQKDTEMEFEIGLSLSTRQPISYLELIKNGQVEHSVRIAEFANSGRLPKLQFRRSGWFLLRAVTDLPKTYRFAMTGPYYVEIGYRPRISKRAAQFFLDWVYERARRIKLTDPTQHREVLAYHRRGRDFWRDLVSRANAD